MRLSWIWAVVLSLVSAGAQQNPGSITGTVVDATDAAVTNATVTIVDLVSQETKTDDAGKFALTGLAPGTYRLRFQVPGLKFRKLTVSVAAGKATSLGRIVVDVQEAPTCIGKPKSSSVTEKAAPPGAKPRIWGSAHGETGVVLTELNIQLLDAGTSKVIATTNTGNDGRFQLVGVAPGVYDLQVTSEGSKLTTVPKLRVKDGHELKVRLTWTQPQSCL